MQRIYGTENTYKNLIDQNLYYVDRTEALEQLDHQAGMVNILLRPEGFGRSLFLDMVHTFFEDERDEYGNHIDNSRYFEGKKIMLCDEDVLKEMGRHPVIHLRFNEVQGDDIESALLSLRKCILSELDRHAYVFDSLNDFEKRCFLRLKNDPLEEMRFISGVEDMTKWLSDYHQAKTVVLIDDYDVPLERAARNGYYEDMMEWLYHLYHGGMKDNSFMYFGLIMGRIRADNYSMSSVESTVMDWEYCEYFGFTEEETSKLLADFHMRDRLEEIGKRYGGYRMGKNYMYRPADVIRYANDRNVKPRTSDWIIEFLLKRLTSYTRDDLETLLAGGTIEKLFRPLVTYEDLGKFKGGLFEDCIWTALLFFGYLRLVSVRLEDPGLYAKLCIPNNEVKGIFRNRIDRRHQELIDHLDGEKLKTILLNRQMNELEVYLSNAFHETVIYKDEGEEFYDDWMTGILEKVPGYEVYLAEENLILEPENSNDPVMILRLAFLSDEDEMTAKEASEETLKKMKDSIYTNQGQNVIFWAVVFWRRYIRTLAE